MKKNIKMYLILFLLCIASVFSENEIPHEIIKENPNREITTVESKKIKEKAELDILVKKITPITIEGVTNGLSTFYTLPEIEREEIKTSEKNNEYFISENINDILNLNKTKGRSKRSINQGIDYLVEGEGNNKTLIVSSDKPVYIGKLKNGKVENIFSGRVYSKITRNITQNTTQRKVITAGHNNTTLIYTFLSQNYPTTYINSKRFWTRMYSGGRRVLVKAAERTDIYDKRNYSFTFRPFIDRIQFGKLTEGEAVYIGSTSISGSNTRDGVELVPWVSAPEGGWYRQNDGWRTDRGRGQDFALGDITDMDFMSNVNFGENHGGILPATVNWVRLGYRLESTVPSMPGVYVVDFQFLTSNLGFGTRTENITMEFLVKRGNFGYTVSPKMSSEDYINPQNKVFDESNSTITGSGTSFPSGWNYRYDDSTEGSFYAWGLYIKDAGQSGITMSRNNKRNIILTSGTGTQVNVWLDRVNGIAKLKYKFLKLSGQAETISLKVIHEAYNENLYEDTVSIKVPKVIKNSKASLNLDGVAKGTWGEWFSGVSGNAAANNNSKYVLAFSEGSLFNFKGSNGLTNLTKLVLKDKKTGQTLKTATATAGNRIEVITDDNKIGFANNHFFIDKLTHNPETKKYILEASTADGYIGGIELTITNGGSGVTKELGKISYRIDKRLKEYVWIYGNYKISTTLIENSTRDYSEFIEIKSSLSNLTSSKVKHVIDVKGKTTSGNKYGFSDGTKYIIYKINNSVVDQIAVPTEISLNEIGNKFVITNNNSIYDSETIDTYQIMTEDGNRYNGTIGETYVEARGISSLEATLNTSGYGINTWGWWTPQATGAAPSETSSKYVLNISSGDLTTFTGMKGNHFIVNKLVVEENGVKVGEQRGTIGGKFFVQTNTNSIGFDSGYLFISKLSDAEYEKKYTIKGYYNEVLLGKLIVTVKNTPVDIGEVNFKIDKRILKAQNNWLDINGILSHSVATNSGDNYSGFFETNGEFQNYVSSDEISSVIEVKGKNKYGWTDTRGGISYNIFGVNGNDESAIPYGIRISDLKSKLLISKLNSTGSDLGLNSYFRIKSSTEREYTGNIKETYEGEEAITLEGKITFIGINRLATWSPKSTGASNVGDISLVFTKGDKLFDVRSLYRNKKSLVTKLVIKNESGGVEKEVTGNIGTTLSTVLNSGEKFEIDSDGNLSIQNGSVAGEKTYTVETYYNEVLLGKATLKLITRIDGFIIEGEDTFDFGKMLPGKEYNLNGKIYIKNTGKIKVTDVTVPKSAEMGHKLLVDEKIPLEINSTSKIKEEYIETIIDLKATPNIGQQIGEYEGEFPITITIE